MADIQRVGVLGCGLMGSGIAQVAATAGYETTVRDVSQEILDRGRGLAMSSAYRNLTVLEHAGVVKRVITQEDFGRYELAEELTEHHHHLVCTSCGVVRDLGSDVEAERLMDQAMRRATEQGFTPATHRLDILGLCARCAATEPA